MKAKALARKRTLLFLSALFGAGLYYTLREPKPTFELRPRRKNWDAVDRASRESFPASDPPSW